MLISLLIFLTRPLITKAFEPGSLLLSPPTPPAPPPPSPPPLPIILDSIILIISLYVILLGFLLLEIYLTMIFSVHPT